jgi:ribosomal protein S18 acetylase RimI-like enzyme
MKFTRHSFINETDKFRMANLARQYADDNLHVTDLPYRFSSWAFDQPENISQWFDSQDELAAWAVLQGPWWSIDYACRSDEEANLHLEILEWADQRARALQGTGQGRPMWFVNVFSCQKERIRQLEEAGYRCQADVGEDSWSKVLMRLDGQTFIRDYAPPPGFVVRPLKGEEEVHAYVELHRSVFESKTMTPEWRSRTLRHPAYRPGLDLVVEAPDGRLAAFCIAWLDKSLDGSLVGQIEPLGCHKDFRRYALGRIVLAEGLRRLQTAGAKDIFVETDNYRNTAFRLYESFGFRMTQDVLVYRKDYELSK